MKKDAKKQKSRRSLIVVLLGCLLVLVASFVSIRNFSTAFENKKQIDSINNQIESYCSENDKLESFLDDENHDEYFEKVAREQYDYAKPGEKVYFDSSFGK